MMCAVDLCVLVCGLPNGKDSGLSYFVGAPPKAFHFTRNVL